MQHHVARDAVSRATWDLRMQTDTFHSKSRVSVAASSFTSNLHVTNFITGPSTVPNYKTTLNGKADKQLLTVHLPLHSMWRVEPRPLHIRRH